MTDDTQARLDAKQVAADMERDFQRFGRLSPPTRIKIRDALAELERMTAALRERDEVLRKGVEAFRLTREYVGEDLLPPTEGWSWFDWCKAALYALPHDGPECDLGFTAGRCRRCDQFMALAGGARAAQEDA